MPGSSYQTAPDFLRQFIDSYSCDAQRIAPSGINSIILHGSLAMGSFYAPKSDIDVLVVAEDLTDEERQSLYDLSKRYHVSRPFAGGLEVNAVQRCDAENPRHPTPSLMRFSETTEGIAQRLNGKLPADEDLVSHLTVSRHTYAVSSG